MTAEDTQRDQQLSDQQAGYPNGGVPALDLPSKETTGEVPAWSDEARPQEGSDDAKSPQDPTTEPASERPTPSGEDYSVFTVPQKRMLILTASLAAFFSPMTGSIYYPATNAIAADLHVSPSAINLTVTTYLIIQGLAPMMIAGFSDTAGRRPAYILCFVIYIIANLALSLQNDYVALLILRMMQSAGSSGTVALANGVVGDCVTSAERGKYVAFASLGSLLGPSISPILGGVLSQYAGWHWVFWFLLIFSCVFFIPLALFMPETCRKIVGDGSIPPPKLNMSLTDHIRYKNRAKAGMPINLTEQEELRKNYKLTIPNPMSTLRVLVDPEAALILLPTGIALACFYAISTGASSAFKAVYGFNDLQISLMFLPIGGGSLVSATTTGKMVDWNFRRYARLYNFPVEKNRQRDLTNFPIEKARLQICLPLFWIGAATIAGYGWMMDHHISIAGPIILLFILGYCLIASSQVLNVILVDIFPGRAAAATAANNVCRCLLGAAASAAIVPMSEAIGNGWSYTILALLFLASSSGIVVAMKYGMKWRGAKKLKQDQKDKDEDTARLEESEAKKRTAEAHGVEKRVKDLLR